MKRVASLPVTSLALALTLFASACQKAELRARSATPVPSSPTPVPPAAQNESPTSPTEPSGVDFGTEAGPTPTLNGTDSPWADEAPATFAELHAYFSALRDHNGEWTYFGSAAVNKSEAFRSSGLPFEQFKLLHAYLFSLRGHDGSYLFDGVNCVTSAEDILKRHITAQRFKRVHAYLYRMTDLENDGAVLDRRVAITETLELIRSGLDLDAVRAFQGYLERLRTPDQKRRLMSSLRAYEDAKFWVLRGIELARFKSVFSFVSQLRDLQTPPTLSFAGSRAWQSIDETIAILDKKYDLAELRAYCEFLQSSPAGAPLIANGVGALNTAKSLIDAEIPLARLQPATEFFIGLRHPDSGQPLFVGDGGFRLARAAVRIPAFSLEVFEVRYDELRALRDQGNLNWLYPGRAAVQKTFDSLGLTLDISKF